MNIRFEYLNEPKLQFGAYFEHEDTKTGLAEFGPFGKNISGLHPSEIKLGFIGTRQTIDGAKEWVEKCRHYIESENLRPISKTISYEGTLLEGMIASQPELLRLYKILNRDFIGFEKDTKFECSFALNPRWENAITPREIKSILERKTKEERILGVVELIANRLSDLVNISPKPDVVIIALTQDIEEQADTVRISGNFYLNLRRAIKARAMDQKMPVPVQLIRQRTLEGKGDLQEVSTRAWNFCTALYYKAEGIPWRLITLEQDACYVGVSFYVAQETESKSLTMRSSIAQAFDFHGQGLILRGDQFQWDSDALGPKPHLTKDAANKLIYDLLKEYEKLRKVPPRRIVIHKTSEFWGTERGDYNELDGFYEGIDDFYPNRETDFVVLQQTGVRLFREGNYPPLRGTYFTIDDSHHFLYTMGFIPYLETYPKPYVPEPWQIVQHFGGSSKKDLFKEVLALTKMNVNNCAFADGTPITISFSQKVGEIMKHVPESGTIQSQYRFYM